MKKHNNKKPKRDFLFIDESGIPGKLGSPYYTCSILHTQDTELDKFRRMLTNYRFYRDYFHEIKWDNVDNRGRRKICQLMYKNREYFKASSVFLRKETYRGPYLSNSARHKTNPTLLRKYMYREVLNLHFKKFKPKTNNIQIVLDRCNFSPAELDGLKTYLNKYGLRNQKIDYLYEGDSTTVDMLQLSDIIAGSSTDININKDHLFNVAYINIKDISLENADGEKY